MSDTPMNEGSIKDVLERVAGDPAKAAAALDEEAHAEKPRKGLVTELNDIVASAKPSDPPADASDASADPSATDEPSDGAGDASSGPADGSPVEVLEYEPAEDWMKDAYPDGWEPAYPGEEPPRQSNNILAEPEPVIGTDPVGGAFVGFGVTAVSRVVDGVRVDLPVDPDTGCIIEPVDEED